MIRMMRMMRDDEDDEDEDEDDEDDDRDLRIVFCVRIESRIESAVRFDFESNFRIESAVYTTQAATPSNELQGAPCRRTV